MAEVQNVLNQMICGKCTVFLQ